MIHETKAFLWGRINKVFPIQDNNLVPTNTGLFHPSVIFLYPKSSRSWSLTPLVLGEGSTLSWYTADHLLARSPDFPPWYQSSCDH